MIFAIYEAEYSADMEKKRKVMHPKHRLFHLDDVNIKENLRVLFNKNIPIHVEFANESYCVGSKFYTNRTADGTENPYLNLDIIFDIDLSEETDIGVFHTTVEEIPREYISLLMDSDPYSMDNLIGILRIIKEKSKGTKAWDTTYAAYKKFLKEMNYEQSLLIELLGD